MNAITISGLTHSYGDRVALDDVNLSIPAQCMFAFLGPNGGGKSTLFRVLSTMVSPQHGQIRVLGADLPGAAARVRELIGVVFQSPSLDAKLSVHENLRHAGHLYGLVGGGLAARISELTTLLGVQERLNDRVDTLSGGLKRRVELAKCLLHRPTLLLMDEPTTGLDPTARRDFWQMLAEMRKRESMTVVFTTHLFDEADECDWVGILDGGRLVATGAPDVLKADMHRDVITVHGTELKRLRDEVMARHGDIATWLGDDHLRIETDDAAALLPHVLTLGDGMIRTITARHAGLEDVYTHQTRATS